MVIGDVVLDRFICGSVCRSSPEAPVPVLKVEKEFSAPGGAGNTARIVSGLGAQAVLIGRVGFDEAGRKTKKLLAKDRIDTANLIYSAQHRTIEKHRFIFKEHILRADFGEKDIVEIDSDIEERFVNRLKSAIYDAGAIVVSDYEKGTITKSLAEQIVALSLEHEILLIVDTKPEHMEWFRNAAWVKPNRVEAEAVWGSKIETLTDAWCAGSAVWKRTGGNVLLTLGCDGMYIFDQAFSVHIPSLPVNMVDVTGAGDTVAAAFTLALSSGATAYEAARIANFAAAVVIKKPGTAIVSKEELKEIILRYDRK